MFEDSETLGRHFAKNNNGQLRHADASIPKGNLYRCLFQSDFKNSHERFADVVTLQRILCQSNLALTTENMADMVNNSQMTNFSTALVDTQYLNNSYKRLPTFKSKSFSDSDRSIIKKTLAKKLADGGLTIDALRNLYASQGPRGVAAL